MKLRRRSFLHLAAGAVALPAVSQIARAQTYPTRPVRVIVPYPPGGNADITARVLGQWLSERLGQPFITENRAGVAGNIGIEAAAKPLNREFGNAKTGSGQGRLIGWRTACRHDLRSRRATHCHARCSTQ